MTWLVTGGAGYLGAHVVQRMPGPVVVLDDLSTGVPDRLPGRADLVVGSVHDPTTLDFVFRRHRITGVLHLAGSKNPGSEAEHHRQNVGGTASLLTAMRGAGVRRLVFCSSAAVYGSQARAVVDERTLPRPATAYGRSKVAAENLVRRAAADGDVTALILRPFNLIGAGRHAQAGDRGSGNLLPAAFAAVTGGPPVPVTGRGLRDYVDVDDVASAHLDAMRRAGERSASPMINLGTGSGRTVTDVLLAVAAVTGREVPVVPGRPRRGEPASVVATTDKAGRLLGWASSTLFGDSVASAWRAWHSAVTVRSQRPTNRAPDRADLERTC